MGDVSVLRLSRWGDARNAPRSVLSMMLKFEMLERKSAARGA